MKRLVLTISIALSMSAGAEDGAINFCIADLSGYASYKAESNKFSKDKISSSVVVQISKITGVSVMGWENGKCGTQGDFIVCIDGDTMETYMLSKDGDVYYTKTTSNPIARGTKAMVGKLSRC